MASGIIKRVEPIKVQIFELKNDREDKIISKNWTKAKIEKYIKK